MTEPLVAVRDVFCVHRTPEGDAAALQGATLEVAKGEIVCVLGPSGAGKTTLLSVIAGHQVPAAGSVLVAGQDIGRLPEAARARIRHQMIGVMAQSAGSVLPDDLEAHDAISLPLALRGIGRAARRRRAEELLVAVRLSDVARARPHELSGGERQRVALCAALAHRPALLLADEPTAELDAAAARTVHDALAALARAEGTTVVMVSHDPATAALAQRTVQIADGRLAEDGRDGQAAVVVGRGGWLRLPAGILAQAGIGDRVAVQVHEGQVVLTSVTVQSRPSRNGRPAPAPTPPPAAAAAEISVQSVTATLGSGRTRRQVFTDLSCAPPPGRLTVIAGPSGSGKTTLLRLLVGLARAARGTVHVDEVELGALDAEGLAALRRRRIGYLAQDPVAVGFLSATENIALSLRWRGWPGDAAVARATALLDAVGLRERSRQRVSRLSAGEAQRVALARALAAAPGLVIVDEPTSRLDRERASAVAELLAATAAREHQTIVCASHDPDLLERADHRIDLGGDQ